MQWRLASDDDFVRTQDLYADETPSLQSSSVLCETHSIASPVALCVDNRFAVQPAFPVCLSRSLHPRTLLGPEFEFLNFWRSSIKTFVN